MLYLGIDLGTSSVKIVCMNAHGKIIETETCAYSIEYPYPGWSQQEPLDWWKAVLEGCQNVLQHVDRSDIAGISFGGQMHGLVALDHKNNVLHPAILWNDGRSESESKFLNEKIGKKRLSNYCANVSFAGFTASKILWLKKNEPEIFMRVHKILLPKDYIAYRFTGIFSSDVSDASGTLLYDVKHRCWSKEMLDICGITESMLPKVYESYEIVGTIQKEVADILKLSCDVKIIAGAGDNVAAAIGSGTLGEGECNISLGTSGTVFISSNSFHVDAHNALHSFAHGNGKYHLMGCILSAASCNHWWMEDILKVQDYATEQAYIEPTGQNQVFFLPYLMGERSPHNDVFARGAFVNISMNTTRAELSQAILEGVAFAIRDSFEVAKSLGISIKKSRICGGGAKSKLWKQILADVLCINIEELKYEEGPGYGAAILACVGCGEFDSVEEACTSFVHIKNIIKPSEYALKYEQRYQVFKKLYPTLKQTFQELNGGELL